LRQLKLPLRPLVAAAPAVFLALLGACAAERSAVGSAPVAPLAVQPEPTAVERVIELGTTENRVQEHLRHLSEEIGPRLSSSRNLRRASDWTRGQFANWGLDAWIEPWGEFPVGFDRGPWSGGMVAPEVVDYEFITPAWTPGTNGPVSGPVVAYPQNDLELLEALEQLSGAWVVGQPAGGRRPNKAQKEFRTEVEAALAERGALGVIRSSGSELVRTGGNYRVVWDDLPTQVSVVLRGDQYDDLAARMEAGEDVHLEFDIDNRFTEGPIEQVNVVADLVGAELPDEYVIVCGHLDSWDGARGVNDNGTGVSTTLEAARLLAAAEARPKRTIRFILWSGEEQGLLGSKAYVDAHPELMDKISAVLNHDGGTNYLAGLGVTPEMAVQLEGVCAPLVDLSPDMPFELSEREGLPNFGSSDHASFVRAGVPGFFWRQEGRSTYTYHHHTQHDTFDGAIPEYQEHSAVVAAVTALGIANLDALLDRTNMEPIPPRRMGVQLDGTAVSRVFPGSKAEEAGWEAEDEILAIDGTAIETRSGVVEALQAGGPRKVVVIKRGDETVETVLDYSGDEEEAERVRRREERARSKAGG
jgi:hypothetical protein